jgi:NADPH-dependent curcumin reductase CurA
VPDDFELAEVEAAPGAFAAMLRGAHFGKVVVRL